MAGEQPTPQFSHQPDDIPSQLVLHNPYHGADTSAFWAELKRTRPNLYDYLNTQAYNAAPNNAALRAKIAAVLGNLVQMYDTVALQTEVLALWELNPSPELFPTAGDEHDDDEAAPPAT